MKNYFQIFILLFSISFFGCDTVVTGQTPDVVKENFKKKYPGENDPDWQKDKNGNYEAHFKKKGKHYRADFTPDGKWFETESSIKKKDLPDAVQKKIKAEYDDLKIVEIEEVDHHSKGRFYDVEFKVDGKKKDIEFNESGQVIN